MMSTTAVGLALALLSLSSSVHSDQQYFLPIDCHDIHRRDNNTPSGVHLIYPGGPLAPLEVYCDMESDGGGWTVFQRRKDGTVNFYRPWKHYKDGFGNAVGEYWLGLENLFLLTSRKKNRLRLDMVVDGWPYPTFSASHASFSIDHENAGYQLRLGSFTGGRAGDSFKDHNDMKFTTFDKDNDIWDNNCAQHYLGGFWYSNCHSINPNGMFAPQGAIGYSSADCHKYGSIHFKAIEMKIKPVDKCACTD